MASATHLNTRLRALQLSESFLLYEHVTQYPTDLVKLISKNLFGGLSDLWNWVISQPNSLVMYFEKDPFGEISIDQINALYASNETEIQAFFTGLGQTDENHFLQALYPGLDSLDRFNWFTSILFYPVLLLAESQNLESLTAFLQDKKEIENRLIKLLCEKMSFFLLNTLSEYDNHKTLCLKTIELLRSKYQTHDLLQRLKNLARVSFNSSAKFKMRLDLQLQLLKENPIFLQGYFRANPLRGISPERQRNIDHILAKSLDFTHCSSALNNPAATYLDTRLIEHFEDGTEAFQREMLKVQEIGLIVLDTPFFTCRIEERAIADFLTDRSIYSSENE